MTPRLRMAALIALFLTAGPPDRLTAWTQPRAAANRNIASAGRRVGDTVVVRLVARTARWYPEADSGKSVVVQAFAVEGGGPRIPGPMIRVRAGTPLRVTVRNALADTLVLHGLVERPAARPDTVPVAPGASVTVRFSAGAAGTYFYYATTTHQPDDDREGRDSQLAGAFVVDSAGAATPDRVFVIGSYSARWDSAADLWSEALVINGKAWPHTERLAAMQGDTLRWRVISAGDRVHPMHLHGFYYEVVSQGSAWSDTAFDPARRALVVTHPMQPWRTMRMTFVPHTPGNWVFHCHILFHIESWGLEPPPGGPMASRHGSLMDDMRGLVLGLHVRPRPAPPARPVEPARRLRLLVQERPRVFGDSTGYGFVLQEGAEPARDSVAIPGVPIVLTRGEPVRITVVNRLAEPTAVHWHGIELESYFDGVPGISGGPARVAPAIAPGDSFTVQMAPPRAGTFIYHAHFNDIAQIGRGLYGPLLVLEPGARHDPATDLVWIHSQDPRLDAGPILFNGRDSAQPPLQLVAGVRYRIRLIGIPVGPMRTISLMRGDAPATWRLLAKDGADLPPAQATLRPARQPVFIGETYDFAFTPAPGDSLNVVVSERRSGNALRIPVRVR